MTNLDLPLDADQRVHLALWMTDQVRRYPATCNVDADAWLAAAQSLLRAHDQAPWLAAEEPRTVTLPHVVASTLADHFHQPHAEHLFDALENAAGGVEGLLTLARWSARRRQAAVGAAIARALDNGLPVFEPGGLVALALTDTAIWAAKGGAA